MIRRLIGLVGETAERRLSNFVLSLGAAAVLMTLFAAVSLGFGTFAAYVYLRASQGRVVAALIVCAACGLLAIAIWAIGVARRRASRLRRTDAASPPTSPEDVDLLLQYLGAVNGLQGQSALLAATRLGRELSPMQLLVLALIGGFIAGRKLGK